MRSVEPRPTRQRWGVIVLVLVVDLGLAAAGVIMLREGLREVPMTSGTSPSSAKADPPVVQPPPPKLEPPKTTAAVAVKTDDTKAGDTAPPPPPPADPPKDPATDPPKEPAKDVKEPAKDAASKGAAGGAANARVPQHRVDNNKATRKKDGTTGPIDPYKPEPSPVEVGAMIDQLMARSRGSVDACYAYAAKSVPVDQVPHGVVKIAFRVLGEGKVDGSRVLENSTSSEQLATCLVHIVADWTVASHGGDPVDFVRAFSF